MEVESQIKNFIQLNTKILGQSTDLESSVYTEIEALLASHLNLPANEEMASMDVRSYRFKIGTKVTISPSDFSRSFVEKNELEFPNDYEKTYEIADIQVEYHSKNGLNDYGTPMITITAFLKLAE